MGLNKYRAFLKVVEKGSVTAAAEELNHSQSAVTQLLNSFEAELNLKLLTRYRSGIVLTEAGKALLPLIKQAVEADDLVYRTASGLIGHSAGVIRIASFTSVAVNWLPDIIREFCEAEPDINIELVDSGYNNIEKTLQDRQVDLGFVPLPLTTDCTVFPLYNDRLLAVLPANFECPDTCPVSLFETEPVISLLDTIDRDAKSVFEAAGIRPNIRYRVEDDYAMLAMVEKGLGIAIVPELILKGTERKVKILELEPRSYRKIGLAFPDYGNASPAAVKFFEFTINYMKTFTES